MTRRQAIAHSIARPRTRFGEQTYGNDVVFTVDGQETFKLMYDKIHQAKTCIYIANYDLDPALRFVRNSDQPTAYAGHDHEAYPLQDLLVEKAREGVEVKIIVWEPRLVLKLLPEQTSAELMVGQTRWRALMKLQNVTRCLTGWRCG